MAKIPLIVIGGIGYSKVFLGEGDKTAWPPQLEIEDFKRDFMGLFLKMSLFRKDSGFSSKLSELFASCIAPFAADENGDLLCRSLYVEQDVTGHDKQALLQRLAVEDLFSQAGDENCFVFSYVFAEDPLVNGKKLCAFIESVCERTGSDKVRLLCIGCGSTVVTAYLAQPEAARRLDRLVFCFSPLNGTLLASDLFLDSFDYTASRQFLSWMLKKEDAQMFVQLDDMIPGLLENAAEKIFTAVRDLFMTQPAAWALCPSDDYADLAEEFLSANGTLREKTDAFAVLREALPSTLVKLRDSGVKVSLLCGSANRFIPLTQSQDVVSDTLVNTSSAALNESIAEIADPVNAVVDAAAGVLAGDTYYFPGVVHMKAMHTPAVKETLVKLLLQD